MDGKALGLTERDRLLLSETSRFGVVTRDQLTRLKLFGSKTRANERLRKLVKEGYLAARRQPLHLGGPRFIYLPGPSLKDGQDKRRRCSRRSTRRPSRPRSSDSVSRARSSLQVQPCARTCECVSVGTQSTNQFLPLVWIPQARQPGNVRSCPSRKAGGKPPYGLWFWSGRITALLQSLFHLEIGQSVSLARHSQPMLSWDRGDSGRRHSQVTRQHTIATSHGSARIAFGRIRGGAQEVRQGDP